MNRRTLLFGVLLLLIVAAIFWFMLALPQVYRNQDAIVATSQQAIRLTEAALQP